MKKFEIIREIFNTILRVGYEDNKQDAISVYTRDKMTNTVYVKKINIPHSIDNLESIAVTSLKPDFSDSCDCDVRFAFNGKYPGWEGERFMLYANEVNEATLLAVRNYLRENYGVNEDVNAYKQAMKCIEDNKKIGHSTDLNEPFIQYILKRYYEELVKPILDK